MGPMKENDYEAEYDFNTLQRAAEIKQDPQRHTRAKEYGRKKMQAMRSVVGARGPAPSGAGGELSKGYRKLG